MASSISRATGSRGGNFLLAVVCLVAVPLIPLLVEAAKHAGYIQAESYLLTGAVLAAGYAVSTARPWFLARYLFGVPRLHGPGFRSATTVSGPCCRVRFGRTQGQARPYNATG